MTKPSARLVRNVSGVVFAGLLLVGAGMGQAKADPAPPPAPAAKGPPLKIAFSDWPGWTAFEIGIQKGWFKEAGVDVDFSWFEYTPSMEAFAAGKVDAVMMTVG